MIPLSLPPKLPDPPMPGMMPGMDPSLQGTMGGNMLMPAQMPPGPQFPGMGMPPPGAMQQAPMMPPQMPDMSMMQQPPLSDPGGMQPPAQYGAPGPGVAQGMGAGGLDIPTLMAMVNQMQGGLGQSQPDEAVPGEPQAPGMWGDMITGALGNMGGVLSGGDVHAGNKMVQGRKADYEGKVSKREEVIQRNQARKDKQREEKLDIASKLLGATTKSEIAEVKAELEKIGLSLRERQVAVNEGKLALDEDVKPIHAAAAATSANASAQNAGTKARDKAEDKDKKETPEDKDKREAKNKKQTEFNKITGMVASVLKKQPDGSHLPFSKGQPVDPQAFISDAESDVRALSPDDSVVETELLQQLYRFLRTHRVPGAPSEPIGPGGPAWER